VVSKFAVVVLTTSPLEEQLRIDRVLRAHGKALIVADTRGLFGYVAAHVVPRVLACAHAASVGSQLFCDFGDAFMVSDANGEEPMSTLVASITSDKVQRVAFPFPRRTSA
jgi:ubiquitin-activating enzyme E1